MSRLGPTDIPGVAVGKYTRYDDVRGSGIRLFDAVRFSSELGRGFDVCLLYTSDAADE